MKYLLAQLVFPILLALGSFAEPWISSPPPEAGTTWILQLGDPGKEGKVKTTVDLSYVDASGVKQKETIEATADVTAGMGPNQKKSAVQASLDASVSDPANQVDDQSLLETGGSGNAVTITPSSDVEGSFSDVKIEKIDINDRPNTGEKDFVVKPAGTSPGLGTILIEGDITAEAGGASPFFAVGTPLGEVSVTLQASMTKLDLLEQLRAGLLAQGAKVWIDGDRIALYVLIEDGGVNTLGAGTNDNGLVRYLSVTAM